MIRPIEPCWSSVIGPCYVEQGSNIEWSEQVPSSCGSHRTEQWNWNYFVDGVKYFELETYLSCHCSPNYLCYELFQICTLSLWCVQVPFNFIIERTMNQMNVNTVTHFLVILMAACRNSMNRWKERVSLITAHNKRLTLGSLKTPGNLVLPRLFLKQGCITGTSTPF
jgi:hypothetical protein